MYLVRLIVLFFLALGSADSARAQPSPCSTNISRRASVLDLGFGLTQLIPNRLPDFESSLMTYGPSIGVGIPFTILDFQPSLQVSAMYGTGDAFSLWLFDGGLRFAFSTPFFNGFFSLGGHRLNYSKSGTSHGINGGNAGIGVLSAMGKSLELSFSLKGYVQYQPMLAFAFGFTYRI